LARLKPCPDERQRRKFLGWTAESRRIAKADPSLRFGMTLYFCWFLGWWPRAIGEGHELQADTGAKIGRKRAENTFCFLFALWYGGASKWPRRDVALGGRLTPPPPGS
jgi:hypothetical protein